MTDPLRVAKASELVMQFSARTERNGRRYLWTDAFAVMTLLGLGAVTAETHFDEVARALVDRVHQKLGRHRGDDGRVGWLSGLDDTEALEHPTAGGLRIGKALPERGPHDPFDPELEWERDGQYFHYLTKWVVALDRMTRRTADPKFHRWARELLAVAHRSFSFAADGERRLAWKMSIDLSRPLVPSSGQHDAIDGYVTCLELDATAKVLDLPAVPDLSAVRADFASMIDPSALATTDALGLGSLLLDAHRLANAAPGDALLTPIRDAAVHGLRILTASPELRRPADRRLAFRELGLALGLATLELRPSSLPSYLPLRKDLETFWLDRSHQHTSTWTEQQDINEVMLAACMCPDALFATLVSRPGSSPSAIGALNRCIEACVDAEKGYAIAAADVRDPQLKAVLQGYSLQRSEFVQRLQEAITRAGGYPENEGSALGLAHRGAMELRRAISTRPDAVILDECERGEKAALATYDKIFASTADTLPPDVRSLLAAQRAAIYSAYGDLTRRRWSTPNEASPR